MQQPEEGREEQECVEIDKKIPNLQFERASSPLEAHVNRHLAFEKNYPKNIFIPLIEHLSELGLRREYEGCVGTRESFEGKNVVSLAEIYKVMSQQWFSESINLPALISNMSNKILMNSKIKKKLFHLLLIRELFSIPLEDPREFKKIVSKRASEVSQSHLPTDALFDYPSALIYLLSLFADGLSATEKPAEERYFPAAAASDDQSKKYLNFDQISLQSKARQKEISSKEEYKHYISKIVAFLNAFHGDSAELLDLIEAVKARIQIREGEIRLKYSLSAQVPEWTYFSSIVVSNCYLHKRNKNKLTFSMINQWIQQFKEKATSLSGFLGLKLPNEELLYHFEPIVLISPPH